MLLAHHAGWRVNKVVRDVIDIFLACTLCFSQSTSLVGQLDTLHCVSVFGALVYIDVDKAAIKALLTLMYIPLKDT